MKTLLRWTAAIESGAGAFLLAAPALFARLLLAQPLEGSAGMCLARICGFALLALGIACGLAAQDSESRAAKGLVAAMFLYNLGAAFILGAAAIRMASVPAILWPAVVLHLFFAAWCLSKVLRTRWPLSSQTR